MITNNTREKYPNIERLIQDTINLARGIYVFVFAAVSSLFDFSAMFSHTNIQFSLFLDLQFTLFLSCAWFGYTLYILLDKIRVH